MSELIHDCPRCGVGNITFDLLAGINLYAEDGWRKVYEAYCVCRGCGQGTIFIAAQKDGAAASELLRTNPLTAMGGMVNKALKVRSYVSIADLSTRAAPDHLPSAIKAAFEEGAKCVAIGCNNAAGTMFRLCVDLATRSLLPTDVADGPNAKVRRDLGLRLPWLFENNKLPMALKELSHCIKEDGNDGAHSGALTNAEAEDLLDFACMLLERMYTEPKRVQLAEERRNARRNPSIKDV